MLVFAMLLSLSACGLEDIPTYNNFIKTVNGEDVVSENEYSADTIKIGVLESLTGQYASDAEAEINGIKLAHALFPKVNDVKIELVYADNQSDTENAVIAAKSLIEQGCSIIIGSYGNLLSLAVCDTIEEAKIPMIIPSCSNPLLTTTTEYCFRVCVVDAFQGNSAAKYVIEYLPGAMNKEKVNCCILKKAGDEKASALIESFQSKMENTFGGSGYVRVIEYPEGTTDFKQYLERLAALGAEAVFFPSTADEADEVIYQAKAYGNKFRWIGDSDWAKLPEIAQSKDRINTRYLDGVVYVADYDIEAEANSAVAEMYASSVQEYLSDEEPSENVALGFDAYLIALEGLRTVAETEGTDLRYAINRIREMDAATGSITYRAGTGDPVKDVVIEKISGDKIVVDYVAVPNFGE